MQRLNKSMRKDWLLSFGGVDCWVVRTPGHVLSPTCFSQEIHSVILWTFPAPPPANYVITTGSFRATGSSTTHWTYDIVATLNQRTWRWLNAAKTSYVQWEAVDSSAQWTRYIDPMLGHRLWWFSPGHPIFNWYVWLDITLPRKRKRQYIDCLHEFAQWTMVWLK